MKWKWDTETDIIMWSYGIYQHKMVVWSCHHMTTIVHLTYISLIIHFNEKYLLFTFFHAKKCCIHITFRRSIRIFIISITTIILFFLTIIITEELVWSGRVYCLVRGIRSLTRITPYWVFFLVHSSSSPLSSSPNSSSSSSSPESSLQSLFHQKHFHVWSSDQMLTDVL